MNGLALLAAALILGQFGAQGIDPQRLETEGTGGWEEKDGKLQYVIHISPEDAQLMARESLESVANVPQAIAGRFDTVVIRISNSPAKREPSAEVIRDRYPIRGPVSPTLSLLNGNSGGGIANIDRDRDSDDNAGSIIPTGNTANGNLGDLTQSQGGFTSPGATSSLGDARDRDRDAIGAGPIGGFGGGARTPIDNTPPSMLTPTLPSNFTNDSRNTLESPSTIGGGGAGALNSPSISPPGVSGVGNGFQGMGSQGGGNLPQARTDFGTPSSSRGAMNDFAGQPRQVGTPLAPNQNMVASPQSNLFPNNGFGGNGMPLPTQNPFPSSNNSFQLNDPTRVAMNMNEGTSELPPAAKPIPKVIPSSEKGTKLSRSQVLDEDSETTTAGTSSTLPILFLLSVVTNIYSGIYLYKLRERYRSLLLNVRSGVVEA